MRLELPDSYKHVADLDADHRVTGCHIVADNRPDLPERVSDAVRHARGRLTHSLCGEGIDTRPRKAESSGLQLPRHGTIPRPRTDRWFDEVGWTAWPGTCTVCSGRLARQLTEAPSEVPNYKCQLALWDDRGRLRSSAEREHELAKAIEWAEEETRRLNELDPEPAETFTGSND